MACANAQSAIAPFPPATENRQGRSSVVPVTIGAAAHHERSNTWRPRNPVAPRMRRRDIYSSDVRTRPSATPAHALPGLPELSRDGHQLDRLLGVVVDLHASVRRRFETRCGGHHSDAPPGIVDLHAEDCYVEADAGLGLRRTTADEENRAVSDHVDPPASASRGFACVSDGESRRAVL